jgi:hypothetical protein
VTTKTRDADASKSKSDAGGNLSDTATRDVTIVAEGFTGDYEYTVLAGDEHDGAREWLDEHGWSTMGADAALDAYVAAGGFQFVSDRAHADGRGDARAGRELPPLTQSATRAATCATRR